ncbi:hypothetical protein ACFY0G_32350 [Streptomyces sp. NPDC001552]|uniref:hypothetical protein n=1 Tax=Streptomyces sp. NPDC001552 TaxID=3364587 RepID=UPI003690831E
MTIIVQPAPKLRRDFAGWAVAQDPKVRTASTSEFAVPAHLYGDVPEELLIGALVDGHQYVPVPPEPGPEAAPGAVLPEQESAGPGGWLPDLPDDAYPPGAELLGVLKVDEIPADDPPQAPAGEDQPSEGAGDPYACKDCRNGYSTERGLATHRRRAHPKAGG